MKEERSKKSTVVLLPCEDYNEEAVYEKLKEGLSLLGGVQQFLSKEEKILLKPNLLKKAEIERAVITHPSVVGGLVRILREEGYKNLVLSDSCGTGTASKVIKGTGMDEVLEKYHVPVIDYKEGVRVPFPEGTQAREFILPPELLEADSVISISKMKTHALERITGAVKNSYGFVYGLHKAKGHTQYPSADSFARMLIDLNKCVKPKLYIMDGITAMEGNGPGSGDPVAMKVMLLSADPVALDSVFCYLVSLKPSLVPTNYHGEKMGLGTCREENIRILTPFGEMTCFQAAEKYGKTDFQVDRTPVRRNKWTKLARTLRIFQKKPYIVESRCISCGVCVKSCPVQGKAVDFKNGKGNPPVYDYKKCIRCFCCQEMCPEKAIQVK